MFSSSIHFVPNGKIDFLKLISILLYIESVKDDLPYNMLIWYIDYFRLETLEKL
jgi:hypothetical protein